jgi:hypothetical protein
MSGLRKVSAIAGPNATRSHAAAHATRSHAAAHANRSHAAAPANRSHAAAPANRSHAAAPAVPPDRAAASAAPPGGAVLVPAPSCGPPATHRCWCPGCRRDRQCDGRGPAGAARPDRQQGRRRGRRSRHERGRRVVLRGGRDGAGRGAGLGGQHDRDDDLSALPGPHPRHVKARIKLPGGRTVDVAGKVEVPAPRVAAAGETGRARVYVTPTGLTDQPTAVPSAVAPPRRRARPGAGWCAPR